MLITW